MTGSGALRVPAMVTRSGVFEYTDASGKKIKEYRPPAEVLKADSLATLRDLPVTDRHPKGFVHPETWKAVSIGHTSGEARADTTANGATLDLVIADGRSIPKVGKDLLEVSPGYKVRIDETPGVTPEGERYDRVQRDIVYNHIAVGPEGWNRQGPQVAMRLDAGDDEITDLETEPAPPVKKEDSNMIKITSGGKVYEFKTDSEAQAFVDGLAARADTAEKMVVKEKERADAAPALVAEQIIARTALETTARKVLGVDTKFDAQDAAGKPVALNDRAVRVLVIQKFDSTFTGEGASDETVNATYATWVKALETKRVDAGTASIARGLTAPLTKPTERKDGEGDPEARFDADAARSRMRDRQTNGWKKPTVGANASE